VSTQDPESQQPPLHIGPDAAANVGSEKARIASLGRIREVIFGMQDGLISTAILVSSVYGATEDGFLTIIAGLAGGLGGMVSMATGSLLSSRAEKEFTESEIRRQVVRISADPGQERDDMIEILRREGLSEEDAALVTDKLIASPNVFVRTMIEKELGLSPDEATVPWKDAVVMAGSFLLGAAVPVIPYLIMDDGNVVIASLAGTGVALFAMGAGKTLLTERNPFWSGAEIFTIGLLSAFTGYLFGTVVPEIIQKSG
jgi:VIT1/CCC1 family predicted Fe2+/Mn2+ transporter